MCDSTSYTYRDKVKRPKVQAKQKIVQDSLPRRGADSSVVSSLASCINNNPIICKVAKIPPRSKNNCGTLFKTSGSSKYLSPTISVELAISTAATLFGLTKVVSNGIQIAAPNPYAPIARLDINPEKKHEN